MYKRLYIQLSSTTESKVNLKNLFTVNLKNFHIYIGILCIKSFCLISDDTEHDVTMVYYMIQYLQTIWN